jgi:hypothetical protein
LSRFKNLSGIAVTVGDTNSLQIDFWAEPEQNAAEQIVNVTIVIVNDRFRHPSSLLS